jgi:hypothetical protein
MIDTTTHLLTWVSCDECDNQGCKQQVCLECDDTLARECDN